MKIEKNYFKVPNCLMDIKGLTKNQMLVLFSLLMTGSNGAPVYPSYKTIASRCSISERKAIDTVKELENMNVLSITRRSLNGCNYTNLYDINLDVLYSMPVYTRDTGGAQHAPGTAQHAPGVVHVVHLIKNNIDKELNIKKYNCGDKSVTGHEKKKHNPNNFSTCRPTENYNHLAVDLFADDT